MPSKNGSSAWLDHSIDDQRVPGFESCAGVALKLGQVHLPHIAWVFREKHYKMLVRLLSGVFARGSKM